MHQVLVNAPLETLARGALRHEVVNRLLREIFLGRLPAGTRMIAQKLAARFGISSTPVREALLELEAVGLARFVHNRGAVVRPFGPTELGEVFQIRRILESEAVRTACGRIDPRGLEDLRRETDRLARSEAGDQWSELAMAADCKLHRVIAADCGSARLADEIARYDTLVQAIREIVGNRRQAQRRAMEEHLAVIDAVAAGHAQQAAAEMARHIDRTAEDVAAVLFSRRA